MWSGSGSSTVERSDPIRSCTCTFAFRLMKFAGGKGSPSGRAGWLWLWGLPCFQTPHDPYVEELIGTATSTKGQVGSHEFFGFQLFLTGVVSFHRHNGVNLTDWAFP